MSTVFLLLNFLLTLIFILQKWYMSIFWHYPLIFFELPWSDNIGILSHYYCIKYFFYSLSSLFLYVTPTTYIMYLIAIFMLWKRYIFLKNLVSQTPHLCFLCFSFFEDFYWDILILRDSLLSHFQSPNKPVFEGILFFC